MSNNRYLETNLFNNNKILLTNETFDIISTFGIDNEIVIHNINEQKSIEKIYNLFNNKIDFIFLDIGANCGLYCFLTKFIKNSKCYAFEPLPQNINILEQNIKLNNLQDCIHLCNDPLSDEIKKDVYLKIPTNNFKNHTGLCTLGDNPNRFDSFETLKLKTDTIDNFIYNNNISHIDFIKIDTEGWEYFILKGGEKCLRKFKPVLIIEFNEENMKQCNVQKENILSFLKNLNYKTFIYITHEDLLII